MCSQYEVISFAGFTMFYDSPVMFCNKGIYFATDKILTALWKGHYNPQTSKWDTGGDLHNISQGWPHFLSGHMTAVRKFI